MSKKSNIQYQIKKELSKETKYGESKKEAKRLAKEKSIRTGEPYKPPRGIYSTKTYSDYTESATTFANYCMKNHSEIRNIYDCEKYIPEYISDCRDRNLSEWTINKYIYSLSSVYHKEAEELGAVKGVRSRANVKRCRNAEDHKLRQQERYQNVVTLVKATGCRHKELLRLRKEDFRENADGTMSVFKRGKNNLHRWCLVDPGLTDFVRKYVTNKDTVEIAGEQRLFKKSEVPSKLPLHDCRCDYAKALYEYYSEKGYANGKMYHCRKDMIGCTFDKGVLEKVSFDLQHSRNNVVISYLWK